ncbi:MAG: tRNA(Ile)-lysidine synthase [Rhodospirillaceae bacterium]|nr:tRNA(Ile)-lysidine synthase [Rhodospirillaceae bacterium]HEV7547577.1 tRNA lysidine(34) synthetase TilS [Reyranella sp.]
MIARQTQPLDTGAFARLMAPFEPFETSPVLAAAVSGGRDSLALTLLSHDWAAERGGRVVGLIVDHGLRAESAAEATATQAVLARAGIEGAILPWSGDKPRAGLQEAARMARYRLLRDECRRRGILHLLLAHHADDQAETVAMRLARRSGPDGLAGMAALVDQPEVRLLRPLLGESRARLTATLLARGVQWLDDPSNVDPRFERARLRAGGVPALLDSGGSVERSVRDGKLARAAVDMLAFDQAGMTAIDRTGFARLDRDLQARLLSRVIQAVGGRDYPPRRERLERAAGRLCASLDRGKSGKGQDFTLSGCKLMLRRVPDNCQLHWIVRPEHGRNMSQPLIPAAFFACGTPAASHLE